MRMRPLIIDEAARAAIAKVLDYAKDHHFHQGDPPATLDSNYCVELSTYRVIFTFTNAGGALFRHMTISVPDKNLYPNPASAFMLAHEFGYTGWDQTMRPPLDWGIKVDEEHHCIVIAQKLHTIDG
jgi:hypothetical protein